jgi:hypothetical protein
VNGSLKTAMQTVVCSNQKKQRQSLEKASHTVLICDSLLFGCPGSIFRSLFVPVMANHAYSSLLTGLPAIIPVTEK